MTGGVPVSVPDLIFDIEISCFSLGDCQVSWYVMSKFLIIHTLH